MLRILVPVVLLATPTLRAERIVTLGDSLTFAYEAEFGFKFEFVEPPIGDGFGPTVRNWAEILNNPAYRKSSFDLGPRREITNYLTFPFSTLLIRHESNWAIPGLKIDQLRRFMEGSAFFTDLIGENPEFGLLAAALNLTSFDEAEDFNVTDLENQIRAQAARLTLFIGGNDVRGIYANVYNGLGAGNFTAEFLADTNAILTRVQNLNPSLQIVLVNVPHIGITPDIKSSYPTNPVKTGRVTAVLRDLNQQLAAVATTRGIGYADVFTPTLPLLDEATFCLQGIPFFNSGTTTGDLNHVWLNGELSANFHPNTNAQVLIANEIIHAFNRTYQNGIRPLSATEMLSGILGKSGSEIDMPFATWMTAHGLDSLSVDDDSDGDGLTAGVEFGLGLNPRLDDSEFVTHELTVSNNTPVLRLSYPVRLPTSTRYTLFPASSPDLTSPFTPIPSTSGVDGIDRAMIPVDGGRGFLRLEAHITP